MPFPTWSYFPRNAKAPAWMLEFVAVVEPTEAVISTDKRSGLKSDDVLAAIAPGLSGLRYSVESGKPDKGLRPNARATRRLVRV